MRQPRLEFDCCVTKNELCHHSAVQIFFTFYVLFEDAVNFWH